MRAWRVAAHGLVALGLLAGSSACAADRTADRAGLQTPPKPRPVAGLPGEVTLSKVATDTSRSGARCGDYTFPVSVPNGSAKTSKVWGRLCARGGFTGKTVVVLTPGGAYDHNEYDWPVQGSPYSLVGAATRAGLVTLDLDPIGYGYSDHPDATTLDYSTAARALHDVIQYLRAGALVGKPNRVVSLGHSIGAYTARTEAGLYHDVDGLVLVDGQHSADAAVTAQISKDTYPPTTDPALAGKVPANYLTTVPNTRCRDYYYGPGVDPAVCQLDETLKSTIPLGQLTTLGALMQAKSPADQITTSILNVVGDHDTLYCGTMDCSSPNSPVHAEKNWYPRAHSFEQWFLPSAGHTSLLHRSAPREYAKIVSWVKHLS